MGGGRRGCWELWETQGWREEEESSKDDPTGQEEPEAERKGGTDEEKGNGSSLESKDKKTRVKEHWK